MRCTMPDTAARQPVSETHGERIRALQSAISARDTWLSVLSHIATRVHGEEDEQRILEIGLEEILSKLDLRTGWVFLGDEGEKKLRLAAWRGVAPAYLERVRAEGLEDCLCPEVFESGHRMQARNTRQCPRMPDIVAGLSAPVAHACIPLRLEGASRGVLNIAARPGEMFSDEELSFLETVAHQLCLALASVQHRKAETLRLQEARALAIENAQLYEERRHAYQELKDAQARMIQSEKMAAVGIFASGLAHEVRNPLNSVALQISLLERRAAPLEPKVAEEIRGLIRVIREEVKRLDGLVSDFLELSRAGRLQRRPTDLDALLDEVVRLLRPEAREQSVTLRRQAFGEPLATMSLDGEKLKQVVINLLRNALEAMPGGGKVTLEAGVVGDAAIIHVRDTGPGLPEDLDVFQLFVTSKPGGTGLGLSIAQQIVLEHGGDLIAASEPGKGATFTIRLPLSEAALDGEGVTP